MSWGIRFSTHSAHYIQPIQLAERMTDTCVPSLCNHGQGPDIIISTIQMMRIQVKFGEGLDFAALGLVPDEECSFDVEQDCTLEDLKKVILQIIGGDLRFDQLRLRKKGSPQELAEYIGADQACTSRYQPRPSSLLHHGIKCGNTLEVDVLLSEDENAVINSVLLQGKAARARTAAPVGAAGFAVSVDAGDDAGILGLGPSLKRQKATVAGEDIDELMDCSVAQEVEPDRVPQNTWAPEEHPYFSRRQEQQPQTPDQGQLLAVQSAQLYKIGGQHLLEAPHIQLHPRPERGPMYQQPRDQQSQLQSAEPGLQRSQGCQLEQEDQQQQLQSPELLHHDEKGPLVQVQHKQPALQRQRNTQPKEQPQSPQAQLPRGGNQGMQVPQWQPLQTTVRGHVQSAQRQQAVAPLNAGAYGFDDASEGQDNKDLRDIQEQRNSPDARPLDKAGHWTPQETQELVEAIKRYGKRWAVIERETKLRDQKNLRYKWRNLVLAYKTGWVTTRTELTQNLRDQISELVRQVEKT